MRIHAFRKDLLRPAALDFRFLLSRGYPRKSALLFVGNHFQLHQGERDLLYRGVFTRKQSMARCAKIVRVGTIKGEKLAIDGHNILITLESAIKRRPLLLADDNFVRDISRIFRRFRPTDRTRAAWALVEGLLSDYQPCHVTVLLDAPLPKSGELAARIRQWMKYAKIKGDVTTATRPESSLLALEGIKASADSVIIDRSTRVFDLAGHIIRRRLHIKPMLIP
ncbi:MAG: DUF434 domain-containing protein [Deltaproteobacteria bacterium]|nr:DUF434 domain-containing protein [Deltaproteobacteria bacterium]MBW1718769.1 DUF434 domain-containing protein [Deltaproteobacteria bacterium]MBW1932707.1 DUF434 domain-containing protein [Deltaproteobacteria bacterium]MBW1937890.1 DUF434 domain-containing protein [Deltaproteobacteria bacterium]MBW1963891.1 DUF434 domain-containing protein [Deltaproteobacteria bacterium]